VSLRSSNNPCPSDTLNRFVSPGAGETEHCVAVVRLGCEGPPKRSDVGRLPMPLFDARLLSS
jgi:hypothetical protein